MRNNFDIFTKMYSANIGVEDSDYFAKSLKQGGTFIAPYNGNWVFSIDRKMIYVSVDPDGRTRVSCVVQYMYIVTGWIWQVPSDESRGDESGYDFEVKIESLD